MRTLICIVMVLALVACAKHKIDPPVPEADTLTAEENTLTGAFDLAMDTVEALVMADNAQAAIMRLQQLIANPLIREAERADALYRMAELKQGAGNDLSGAIAALEELLATYPNHKVAVHAMRLLNTANAEANGLLLLLETYGYSSPTEHFETLFRLGRYQDALDIMLARHLKPDNDYILDFYQMGYLCDHDALTGPSYDLIEPDGTERLLYFCDFGK